MVLITATLAIMPSAEEMVVIMIAGILLFGRRLPEVGRSVGRTIAQLRQAFDKFKHQIDVDGLAGETAEVTKAIRLTKNRVVEAVQAPTRLANPMAMLTDLTDETLSSPGPTEKAAQPDQVPLSLFEQELEQGRAVDRPGGGPADAARGPADAARGPADAAREHAAESPLEEENGRDSDRSSES